MALNTIVTTVDPTVAQLGLAIGQLNQQIQQINSKQAASTVSTTTKASASTTTSSGYSEVNPIVSILTSGAAVGWTTIDLSPYIGSSVKRVLLNGYMRTDGAPDDSDQQLNFRADSNSVTRIAAKERGVNGNYSGEQAFNIEVPVSSQSIQYQITANITVLHVWLIETYS